MLLLSNPSLITVKFIVIISILLVLNLHSFAQDKKKSMYNFSDYAIKESIYTGKGHLSQAGTNDLKKIKLPGSDDTPLSIVRYKTNFAGHYEIIEWGCGSPCHMAAIINCIDGSLIGYINSCYGIEYSLDSYLIKTLTIDEEEDNICPDQILYLVKDNKLIEFKKLHAQKKEQPFNKEVKKTYSTKDTTYKFGNVSIHLKQVKVHPLNLCMATLEVIRKGKIIEKKVYNDAEISGVSSFLYVPAQQPINNYFLLSKFGDYDERTFLIDRVGRIIDIPGGMYFVSNNKSHLFIEQYAECCEQLRVFNVNKGIVEFCTHSTSENPDSYFGYYKSVYYYNNNNDVYIILNDNKANSRRIYKYDFTIPYLVKANEENINPKGLFGLYYQRTAAEECVCDNGKK